MTPQNFWFGLIAVLWAGYFMLEGFDFGVGMLLPVIGRNEQDRGEMLDTIGPVWDGNEVWLVVAGGATFAAFPAWYAAMFSGFYQALLLVLVLLMIRVVSFEWRHRNPGSGWQNAWLWCNIVASVGAPLIWGVALSNLVQGVPLNSSGDFAGNFTDLFSAYTVAGGIATIALFALHGSIFLELKTVGELRPRALHTASRLAPPAVAIVAVYLVWTVVVATGNNHKSAFPAALVAALAVAALALGGLFAVRSNAGRAFTATAVGVVLVVATIFTSLYPRVMVSSPGFQNSLTIANSAAAHYALTVMTVVALILTPVVLIYQGWTYYIFRRRLTETPVAAPTPAPAPPEA